jgi:hypothetical protein
MRSLARPASLPADHRLSPIETTVWAIDGTLTLYKEEDDSDYHLVLTLSAIAIEQESELAETLGHGEEDRVIHERPHVSVARQPRALDLRGMALRESRARLAHLEQRLGERHGGIEMRPQPEREGRTAPGDVPLCVVALTARTAS